MVVAKLRVRLVLKKKLDLVRSKQHRQCRQEPRVDFTEDLDDDDEKSLSF